MTSKQTASTNAIIYCQGCDNTVEKEGDFCDKCELIGEREFAWRNGLEGGVDQ